MNESPIPTIGLHNDENVAPYDEPSSIQLYKSTIARLAERCKKNQSYEDLILKLLAIDVITSEGGDLVVYAREPKE